MLGHFFEDAVKIQAAIVYLDYHKREDGNDNPDPWIRLQPFIVVDRKNNEKGNNSVNG